MIISTTDLNNIENKIINPQIEGIEFIIGSYDENTQTTTLNASYNDLINLLTNNKLPVLRFFDNNGCFYEFMLKLYQVDDSNIYCCLGSTSRTFTALNATTNFSYEIDDGGER